MIYLERIYEREDEAAAFCHACEQRFEETLTRISREVAEAPGLRCVTLSGPTCSGKTTTAAKLTGAIERSGRRARALSIDDFYLDEAELRRRCVPDFEGAAAIDLEYFATVVDAIGSGKPVRLPTFDFTKHKRIAYTEYQPDERDIYIFEGIQAIYPEVTEILKPFGFKSVYISVAEGVSICGTMFAPEEIRLMRRIVRDFFHRDAAPSETMTLWDSVRENEEKSIFPYVEHVDITINSMLPYEVLLIGRYFLTLTADYPTNGCHADQIAELRARLLPFSGTAVDVSMIPMNSVFREFII